MIRRFWYWLRSLFEEEEPAPHPLIGWKSEIGYESIDDAAAVSLSFALLAEPVLEVAGIVYRAATGLGDTPRYFGRVVAVGTRSEVTFPLQPEALAHWHTHPGFRGKNGHTTQDKIIVQHIDPAHRSSYVRASTGLPVWKYHRLRNGEYEEIEV